MLWPVQVVGASQFWRDFRQITESLEKCAGEKVQYPRSHLPEPHSPVQCSSSAHRMRRSWHTYGKGESTSGVVCHLPSQTTIIRAPGTPVPGCCGAQLRNADVFEKIARRKPTASHAVAFVCRDNRSRMASFSNADSAVANSMLCDAQSSRAPRHPLCNPGKK